MTIDGDTLEIELDMDIEDVTELKDFVKDRLEYIETIKVTGEKSGFGTSSLFQLLFSIKKSRPEIAVEVIESDLKLEQYGTMHWV
jgi:exonuclease VII large subunit